MGDACTILAGVTALLVLAVLYAAMEIRRVRLLVEPLASSNIAQVLSSI